MKRSLARFTFAALCVLGGTPARSEPLLALGDQAGQDPRSYEEKFRPFFNRHCLECHGTEKPKGEFRLDKLSADFSSGSIRDLWRAVQERVTSGAMPPKAKPRPPQKDIDALSAWIDGSLAAAETARRVTQGRVVLRRLNRVEYENTVRDLLSVDVGLQDLLPEDTAAHGFDTVGEAMHASSFLVERYLEAADAALAVAIANGPRPAQIKKRFSFKSERSLKPTGEVYRHLEDALAIFSSWPSAAITATLWQFRTRDLGQYRFRISAYAYQSNGKPVTFHVHAGALTTVTAYHLVGYYDIPADKPTVVEFVDRLEPKSTIRIITDIPGVTPRTVKEVGVEKYKGPGLAVQWVEVEGPLMESWPPPGHKRLFGDLPQAPAADDRNRLEVVSKDPAADAERILRDFTRRAFRRTVTDDDVRPFLSRVKAQLAQGYTFEQAVRAGLKGVMISPEFLFLRETPGKLDDFALASRLSYFLWSSMPDEELLTLAAQRKLAEPDTLRRQVERLLRDPKAAAFTRNFAGQWLDLRAIDNTVPDPTLYPEYNNGLKESMVPEVLLFFDEILKNDLSLTHFVASDFSMLNGPLANLYGIPGVEGRNFRKVTLPPGSHRGGVLTMAAVLKVTANGTNTSPILRGAWVLERILGTPPPKPTADVEAVEPDIRGATTIREQLAKHRGRAECASCHARIDPPGFALESFDVLGGWREYYRSVGQGESIKGRRYKKGPAVDASDVLPDGRRFKNIDEYKQLLLKDKDLLARALAEKLLTYGTGGAPSGADKPEIEAIVRAARQKDYGLRTLIHEIVQSKVFQSK